MPRQLAPRESSEKTWLLFIVCVAFLSFCLACAVGEDSSGGARGDFYLYHWKAVEQFARLPWATAIRDYSSATNPLIYLVASLLPINASGFQTLNGVCAALIFVLLWAAYHARFARFGLNWAWCGFAASAILLSPAYRSAAAWGDTDDIPFLFCVVTSLLLSRIDAAPADGPGWMAPLAALLVMLAAACAFYTRQFYAFLPAVTAWALLTRTRLPAVLVLGFLAAAMVPELLLVKLWDGINPPSYQKHTSPSLSNALLAGANICLFSAPLILGLIRRSIHDALPPWWGWRCTVASACGLLAFVLVLKGTAWPTVGGGLVIKLGLRMGWMGPPFILTLAYTGLLTTILFAMRSSANAVLAGTFVVPFLIATPTYQRYFDAVIVMAVFLYADIGTARSVFTKRVLVCNFAFSALLLTVSLVHYSGGIY